MVSEYLLLAGCCMVPWPAAAWLSGPGETPGEIMCAAGFNESILSVCVCVRVFFSRFAAVWSPDPAKTLEEDRC